MNLTYYIIDNKNRPLSGYYPNDCKNQLRFRKTDCFSFRKKIEAEDFLRYIKKTTIHKQKVNNLEVSTESCW